MLRVHSIYAQKLEIECLLCVGKINSTKSKIDILTI